MRFNETTYVIMGKENLEFYADGEETDFGGAWHYQSKTEAFEELSTYDEPEEFIVCKVTSTHEVTKA